MSSFGGLFGGAEAQREFERRRERLRAEAGMVDAYKRAQSVEQQDVTEIIAALRTLGPDAISAGAAAALRAAHPDTAEGDAPADAGKRIADIRAARDRLLSFLKESAPKIENACPTCLGRGTLGGAGFSTVYECRACGGTGKLGEAK